MKFLLIFLLILVLPITSAIVEFDSKSNFSQGETFLTKISGNFFKPITANDIEFFRNNVRVSIIPIVQEIENEFYVYAQLSGKEPNNYSLRIEEAQYYEGNQIIEEDLQHNFTIITNSSDFSIEPAVVFTEEDFSISFTNLGSQITINYGILNESVVISSGGFFDSLFNQPSQTEDLNFITLKTGETKEISFNITDFKSFTLQKIQFNTDNTNYQIPVYINTEIEESNLTSTGKKIRFDPNELEIPMPLDSKTTRIVNLFNLADEDLEDLELSFSDSLIPYLSISMEDILLISENSSERIELVFNSPSEEAIIEGQVRAKTSDDFFSTISITLNFLENFQPSESEDSTIQTCQEIGGTICTLEQECSGSTEVARNGICCLETCNEIEKGSSGKIIGWLLVIVILIALIWFYLSKYRGVRNVADVLQIAKGKLRR